MAFLTDPEFACVVRSAPLVSIDLILRSPDGKILVGRRENEPAKGTYFVPGGIVRKDETLDHAFERILWSETGLRQARSMARFLGVYEHFYTTNRYGDPSYGTHYVVLGYELRPRESDEVRRDNQHSEFRWMTPEDLLKAPEVHGNTKRYLRF
jgi:colanic acid biosynthesis protein WcaH